MPEISRFLGIIIKMYFKDHNPPHFHVTYGSLPPRIHSYVIEWSLLHKTELLKNWEKAKKLKNPNKIKPLI